MGPEFGLDLIDRSRYGTLSMIDEDNEPYGIPLSIVRDGDNLYFHSAMEGRKTNILKNNPRVSISFVGEISIPENYSKEDLDEIANDKARAVLLIS